MSTDGNLCTEGRALRVPTWRNILVLLLVIEIASVLSENGCAIQSEICVRVSEAYKTTITQQYRKFYSKQLSFVIRTIFAFMKCYMGEGGARWRSWLRHCATSGKVAGSIPDGVIGIFHWHNSSGRSMALALTRPLTEMSTRNISWGVKAAGPQGWNLTTFMCRLSWNLGASTSWNPQGLSRPVMGLLYLFFTYIMCILKSATCFDP